MISSGKWSAGIHAVWHTGRAARLAPTIRRSTPSRGSTPRLQAATGGLLVGLVLDRLDPGDVEREAAVFAPPAVEIEVRELEVGHAWESRAMVRLGR